MYIAKCERKVKKGKSKSKSDFTQIANKTAILLSLLDIAKCECKVKKGKSKSKSDFTKIANTMAILLSLLEVDG